MLKNIMIEKLPKVFNNLIDNSIIKNDIKYFYLKVNTNIDFWYFYFNIIKMYFYIIVYY